MKQEIKERVERIRRGEVPEGYRETKVGIIPEQWGVKKIENVSPLQRGFDLPSNELKSGDYPVVYSNGIVNYHCSYKVKAPGVVTGRSGTIGKVTFVEEDYWPHNTSLWVTDFKSNDPKFIYYLYLKMKLERFGAGSGVPTLNRNDVHSFKIPLPSLLEQEKIVEILSTWDKAIELKEKLIEEKREFKRGLMQKLLTGKVRFPEFTDDWEEAKISKLLGESCELSKEPDLKRQISVKLHLNGVSLRKLKGNEVDGATTLYVRKAGQFIYGKQNFHNGAFGIIPKQLDNYQTSSDIPTFDFKYGINPIYFFYYWSQKNKYLRLEAFTTGTGSKRLNPKVFLKLPMVIPNVNEQNKIVELIDSVNNEINLLNKELNQLKEQKRGLMQLLLTGIARVEVN